MEFCVRRVVFTGRVEDLVLRKDFIEAFQKHSGGSFGCSRSFVQHLMAAGVRVSKLSRHGLQEYCYVGVRLAEGNGRRFSAFMNSGRMAANT